MCKEQGALYFSINQLGSLNVGVHIPICFSAALAYTTPGCNAQYVMSGWEFRTVFWLTAVLRSCAAVVDIVIVKRWNTTVGIPDTWMYMLGYNIVYQACSHGCHVDALNTTTICAHTITRSYRSFIVDMPFASMSKIAVSELTTFSIRRLFVHLINPGQPGYVFCNQCVSLFVPRSCQRLSLCLR